ncbi:MAG TPA: glycosyltransferase family 87 protein [Chloroflexota bacterium]|nr:glycosyltransferase family 87 protein [Chloroflexota bacterium]
MAVALYLAGWLVAAIVGAWFWRWALSGERGGVVWGPGVGVGVVVAALGVAAYWNGAVLDPLQYRGFPDYVTQMRGARRLLAGELPYDPAIRVWTDVNLPPITLLLIFAPFTALSEQAGRLAYFWLNHLAFVVGAALAILRYPGRLFVGGAVGLVALFEPWHDSQRLGQQNGLVFLCLAACAWAAARRWDAAAGVALALALIGKPSAALVGLYFLLDGRWRAVGAAALTGAALFLVTLPWAGVENWRFYLLEKAPEILAGTPQQSNVALLAFHARLFLPLEALASFDEMPPLPWAATALTRVSQLGGVAALWWLVRRANRRRDARSLLLEFGVALALSLALVGHAWQSYLTWMLVAFVPLTDPEVWTGLNSRARMIAAVVGGVCYAVMGINDVALHRVVGSTSAAAAFFAALPTFGLLACAYLLALLARGTDYRST